MKCLFIVDVQNGFISKQTEHVLAYIKELLALKIFDYVIATKFVNNQNSPYRRFLNWDRFSDENEIKLYEPVRASSDKIIEKNIYTALNKEVLAFLTANKIDRAFIAGIDTDCCVLKTAADLFEHNIRPYVLADYSASNGGIESQRSALKVLERLIGKESVVTGQVDEKRIQTYYE